MNRNSPKISDFLKYHQGSGSCLRKNRFYRWLPGLPGFIDTLLESERNGYLEKWKFLIAELPSVSSSCIDLNSAVVTAGLPGDCSERDAAALKSWLLDLAPWRKGPFSLFGVKVDSEWRSDFKWDRLRNAITPLEGRTVLDVGCGNGYHCWRMAGEGAELVIGIDPVLRFFFQFLTVQRYMDCVPVYMLPVAVEELPSELDGFDTVFSMGVLYHRRSPVDHLLKLKSLLKKGGELVLETLVVGGGEREVLVPQGRYGKMNNVWFIPSPRALELWLERCGFEDIRLIDVTKTTTAEQRSTEWMTFESLKDFLNPENSGETVEGLPAPVRAVFAAKK